MKNIELLAPAGNASCALAAFDAGADAIYAGLPKFNARERSENFTPELMAKVIDYAHKNKRKVYVTVNTVVKEKELAEMAEYLALLSDLSPDALIVQDLGVLRMIREYFPQLTIHASTQMGIHNSAGLKMAEKMGVKRVILERQMTYDEIDLMRKESDMELEIFAHGALCCSLSGQCLFSSWHGGASGNRGRCKQACRRRFFSREGNGFFFSTQDLCLIDQIDKIRSLGIASLKIEGRLRQPDYVKNVVSAYRMVLDAPEINGKVLGEARNILSRTCGRKWSHGFTSNGDMKSLVSHENMGAAGTLCGSVSELRDNGFGFTTSKKLHLGDRIRIQPLTGDEGPALTVTRMFVNNRNVKKAHPGDEVFICCDKIAPHRGLIFKIGESCEDYSGRIAALPAPRKELALNIDITAKGITVKTANAPLEDWHVDWSLEKAENRALTAETVAETFKASDLPELAGLVVKCRIDGDYFCPVAVLKNARRAFWDYASKVKPEEVSSASAAGLEKFRRAMLTMRTNTVDSSKYPETVAVKPNGELPGNRRAIRAAGIFEMNKLVTEAILPEFMPEGKLPVLAKAIASAYANGIRKFRSSALYSLEMLQGYSDIEITAGGALPICNSMAVRELEQFGVTKVLAHVELEKEAVIALAEHSPVPVELYRQGRPVLLITRAAIPADGDFKDARGNEFIVKFDRRDGLTRVYPKKIVSVPRVQGLLDYYDMTNANWNAKDVSTFNFATELL